MTEIQLASYRDIDIEVPERRARVKHDMHHHSFSRVIHSADPFNRAIREHPNNIHPIQREYHEGLHRKIIYTPPFPYQIATRVLKNLRIGRNAEERIDNYIDSVEQAVMHPRATYLDAQLAKLAIDSLLLQAPYLIQGEYHG